MANSRMKRKDPDALKDYRKNWALWLAGEDGTGTDTILDSTWTIPDGLTLEDETFDDTTATIWLSGGTLRTTYTVTNHITTTEGREEEDSFYITIRNQ